MIFITFGLRILLFGIRFVAHFPNLKVHVQDSIWHCYHGDRLVIGYIQDSDMYYCLHR